MLPRSFGRLFLLAALPAVSAPQSSGPRLDHIREVNLAYAASLPSFVADETAKRSVASAGGKWRNLDTVETEIAFNGPRVLRTRIRRNGKPWEKPFEALPGFKWYGGFGTEIKPIFDPECPTTLTYESATREAGRRLAEYSFSSPADGCFTVFYFEGNQANPPRTGRVYVDDPGGSLLRLEEDAADFPPGFEFSRRHEEVRWDYVTIAGAAHLLPVAASFLVEYSSGARTRIEVTYANHRHFEAASNVTFPKNDR